jgi:NADH-quinone oxidoreductase E subunit
MAFEFSAEGKKAFENILIRYPQKESALLPTLHLAQKEFGHFTVERMDAIADLLDLPKIRVYRVVSFYTMYQRQEVGKYLLQVCTNVSCSLLGAEKLVAHLEEKLDITVGETTPDGLFTLCEVECLGACGNAPVMMVNDDYYEDLSVEKVDALLDQLKRNART